MSEYRVYATLYRVDGDEKPVPVAVSTQELREPDPRGDIHEWQVVEQTMVADDGEVHTFTIDVHVTRVKLT